MTDVLSLMYPSGTRGAFCRFSKRNALLWRDHGLVTSILGRAGASRRESRERSRHDSPRACEHVLEESARLVSALLAECPHVRVLATSREVLHVVGEVRVIVDPLGLPGAAASDAAAAPAVELFTARARAARPGFRLTDEDAWPA